MVFPILLWDPDSARTFGLWQVFHSTSCYRCLLPLISSLKLLPTLLPPAAAYCHFFPPSRRVYIHRNDHSLEIIIQMQIAYALVYCFLDPGNGFFLIRFQYDSF
jgi:hypothetical protein